MSIAIIAASLATGLLLGVFGSGGSIVTLPALIYLLGVDPKAAIAMSLGIVAVTAGIAAVQQWRQGHVDLRVTAVFGLFGVIGTFAGARIGVVTPVVIQLGLFAVVMYLAAWRLLRPVREHRSVGAAVATGCASGSCTHGEYLHIAWHGIAVGVLTGVVGVGGGFLIVPALVLLSGLSMKKAIGTSLAIVTLKSMAGFAGYAGSVAIDYRMMAMFTTLAVAGGVAGNLIGRRVSGDGLKRGFGAFLVVVASYIIIKNLV